MFIRKEILNNYEKYSIKEAIGYILLTFDELKIEDIINKKLYVEIAKKLIFEIQKYKKEYAKCRFYNFDKLEIAQDEINLEEVMSYLLITVERLTIEKIEFNEENITKAFFKTINAYSPEGAIKRADIILKKIGIG